MKAALVTGATGFIGSHLVDKLLDDGWTVRALVRSPLPLHWHGRVTGVEGDLRSPATLRHAIAGADTVFHLAARVHADDDTTPDAERAHAAVNADGTLALTSAAQAAGVRRFVFFSSVKAVGEATLAGHPIDETCSPEPKTPYGRAKLAGEQAVAALGPSVGVSLRLPMVYGVGNKGNITRMIEGIHRGRFPPWPGVENRRSMAQVTNVVCAARLVAANPTPQQVYFVTDRHPYSTRELYDAIREALGRRQARLRVPWTVLWSGACLGTAVRRITGRRLPLDLGVLQKLAESAWYSSARLTTDVGYQPAADFRSTLPELIAAYRSLLPR